MTNSKTNDNILPEDFDPEEYLSLNPDVAAANVDAATHYLEYGRIEGRHYSRSAVDELQSFTSYLAKFSGEAPSDQNAVDLFNGVWSSFVPNAENTGTFRGFKDPRIEWIIDEIGSIKNFNVMELGPLEGAHTRMLEQAGANVHSIEANLGAFLRCLIIKNHLDMKAKFTLGDFNLFDFENNRFDLILACGVLYHMRDPISLLEKISSASDRVFIWTHYYEEDLSKWYPELRNHILAGKWDTKNVETRNVGDQTIRMVRQEYRESIGWDGFCGGTEDYSYWLYKEDIISLLRSHGLTDIRVNFDVVDHQNGPSFAVLAQRPT